MSIYWGTFKPRKMARKRWRADVVWGWVVELAAWAIVVAIALAAGWSAVVILRAIGGQ